MTSGFDRRTFLKAIPVALAAGAGTLFFRHKVQAPTPVPGVIRGGNAKVGHLMRFGKFPVASDTMVVDTVIVGGGVAGLSAGWWLQKKGHKNFMILELDEAAGGNSRGGNNSVSAYPWGAHYVPLPGEDAKYVRELFEELKVIKGFENGLPVYDEYYLCADLHERIYFQGKWREGVIPQHGIPEDEHRQYQEFFAYTKELSEKNGKDGKPAFTIPLDLSSRDDDLLALDKVSFRDYLNSRGWTSTHLHWYADYCCRDDYGQDASKVSAWAGLHYFASRGGKAHNASGESLLTWPEGNGWLVKKMAENLPVFTNRLVTNIAQDPKGYSVKFFDVTNQKSTEVLAKHVIYAGARFTTRFVIDQSIGPVPSAPIAYAPWMVANITLKEAPKDEESPIAWDNVSYYSRSLGYIVATHQQVGRAQKETVWTYYLPLDEQDPVTARTLAQKKTHQEWSQEILADLEKFHPGITPYVKELDVWIWGHGMVSPGINFLWSRERLALSESIGHLHFAHTDQSGISIFEEAQYRGVMAAKKVLGEKA